MSTLVSVAFRPPPCSCSCLCVSVGRRCLKKPCWEPHHMVSWEMNWEGADPTTHNLDCTAVHTWSIGEVQHPHNLRWGLGVLRKGHQRDVWPTGGIHQPQVEVDDGFHWCVDAGVTCISFILEGGGSLTDTPKTAFDMFLIWPALLDSRSFNSAVKFWSDRSGSQSLQKALQLYANSLCRIQRELGASTPSTFRLPQTQLASKGHITFTVHSSIIWVT